MTRYKLSIRDNPAFRLSVSPLKSWKTLYTQQACFASVNLSAAGAKATGSGKLL